jgi:hypothetical protein
MASTYRAGTRSNISQESRASLVGLALKAIHLEPGLFSCGHLASWIWRQLSTFLRRLGGADDEDAPVRFVAREVRVVDYEWLHRGRRMRRTISANILTAETLYMTGSDAVTEKG